MVYNKLPTEDVLQHYGIPLASVCRLCFSDTESINHIFVNCSFSHALWDWISTTFHTTLPGSGSFMSLWPAIISKNFHFKLAHVWRFSCFLIFYHIWKARNRIVFENTTYSHGKIIMSCKSYLRSWSSSCPGSIYSISDLRILKAIGISANNCRAPRITQVLWLLPIYPFIKVNTDGLSKGNPGEAACGGVFRDRYGKFLGMQ